MKAVVWTDVFQGLVLFAGVIAVLIVVGLLLINDHDLRICAMAIA